MFESQSNGLALPEYFEKFRTGITLFRTDLVSVCS